MSEATTINQALVLALAAMPTIPKAHEANMGSYRVAYADLADIIAAVRPVLASQGLAVTQNVTDGSGTVAVSTTIHHSGGERLDFGPLSLPAGRDAQTTGGAITYARRYALVAALGLATEDDDDGRTAAKAKPAARTTAPQAPARHAEAPPLSVAGADGPLPNGFASKAQQNAMLRSLNATAKAAGIDRDDELAWLTALTDAVDHRVDSSLDLTPSEMETAREAFMRLRAKNRAANNTRSSSTP